MYTELIVPKRLSWLAPVECELVRLGRDGDGGYVLAAESLKRSKALVSLGISSEWSFDTDFLAAKRGVEYIACDRGTGFIVNVVSGVRSIFKPSDWENVTRSVRVAFRFLKLIPPVPFRNRRRFYRKWVRTAVVDRKRDVLFWTLFDSLHNRRDVFLKMDIDGGEYEIIPEIARIESENPGTFAGIVMELHDVLAREDELTSLMKQLLAHFEMVHVHVNNCIPTRGDFPDFIEVALAPKDWLRGKKRLSRPNHSLDLPNEAALPDIDLAFSTQS